MGNHATKQKIITAAFNLFYQKGFKGTSVRDIAEKAHVNVAAISYHFNGKQGLLEYVVTHYYENYLIAIEELLIRIEKLSPLERLKKMVAVIIQYKQENQQLSCFIHRELSYDSVFSREIVVTYLAKENHYIRELFFAVLKERKIKFLDWHFLLMQLNGMLITPYILHSELKSQVIGIYPSHNFTENYVQIIHKWLDCVVN